MPRGAKPPHERSADIAGSDNSNVHVTFDPSAPYAVAISGIAIGTLVGLREPKVRYEDRTFKFLRRFAVPGSMPTINMHISDMLGLERHMLVPFEKQQNDEDVQALAGAKRLVDTIATTSKQHIDALTSRLDEVGGHSGSQLKWGFASALGNVASAIGGVRKMEVSKDIRDDYTAMCLASAGYTMLHTTALALGDHETADLAKKHLSDYAACVLKASAVLPSVVLSELSQDGLSIDSSVAAKAQKDTEEAWSAGASRR